MNNYKVFEHSTRLSEEIIKPLLESNRLNLENILCCEVVKFFLQAQFFPLSIFDTTMFEQYKEQLAQTYLFLCGYDETKIGAITYATKAILTHPSVTAKTFLELSFSKEECNFIIDNNSLRVSYRERKIFLDMPENVFSQAEEYFLLARTILPDLKNMCKCKKIPLTNFTEQSAWEKYFPSII